MVTCVSIYANYNKRLEVSISGLEIAFPGEFPGGMCISTSAHMHTHKGSYTTLLVTLERLLGRQFRYSVTYYLVKLLESGN